MIRTPDEASAVARHLLARLRPQRIVAMPPSQRTIHARPTGGQFRTWWRPYWRWSGRGRLPAVEVGVRRTITREYVEIPEGWSPAEGVPAAYTVQVPDEHCIRLELR